MMIGFIGRMRSGKTLMQSILAEYLHEQTGLPIYANYDLKNSISVKTTADIWRLKNCIFCFDEIWLTLDSRFWKDNAILTYWIMQTRKRGVLVFYTAQIRTAVELRFRYATDFLVCCQVAENGHKYTFLQPDLWDPDQFTIGKSFNLTNADRFYSIYDSFKLMWPIEYVKLSKNEIIELSS